DDVIAELAQPAAEVAQQELVAAGGDLDAAGIAAKGAADRKWQVAVDKAVDRFRRRQVAVARGNQRLTDLAAYRIAPQRRRQRAAGAPEMHGDDRRPIASHVLSLRPRWAEY